MVTNDFIQGYLAALDNLESAIESMHAEPAYEQDIGDGYCNVIGYIKHTRENYKQLIQQVNEKNK